ncbi:MAG: hypothetical protein ACD_35C00144G0004 [uncultured bacterium]|nr:MAG: hypothetical protein ACD_35C00144G0004 [uncultured bacterium]
MYVVSVVTRLSSTLPISIFVLIFTASFMTSANRAEISAASKFGFDEPPPIEIPSMPTTSVEIKSLPSSLRNWNITCSSLFIAFSVFYKQHLDQ